MDITPLKCLEIFEKIKEEEILLMNMDFEQVKPKDLIVTHILVPPVCIRPTVPIGVGLTNEDDLTIKIMEMIQINNLILKGIEEGIEPTKFFINFFFLNKIYCFIFKFYIIDIYKFYFSFNQFLINL